MLASSAGPQNLRKMVIAVTAQLFCAAQRLPCLQAPLDNGTREEKGGAGRRAGGCLSTKSSRPEKKPRKFGGLILDSSIRW